MNNLKQKEGLLLTDDLEQNEQINDLQVQFKPVWKFLIASDSINLI